MRVLTAISASVLVGLGPVLIGLALFRQTSDGFLSAELFYSFFALAVLIPVVASYFAARQLRVTFWTTCLSSSLVAMSVFVALWLASFSLACDGIQSPFFRMSCN